MKDELAVRTHPGYYEGQKILAYVAPFGWEKALYMRHVHGSNQIIRMDAATVDFVKNEHIKAQEWRLEQDGNES